VLNVTVENIGELAVVECEGRIVQSDSAYKLRETVTSLKDSRIVVLSVNQQKPQDHTYGRTRLSGR
jgi:hypothetical protein